MAIIAIPIERKLTNPPLTDGDSDSRKPISPKANAMRAKITPPNAPTKKLAIAATRAIIDGMLKCALEAVSMG